MKAYACKISSDIREISSSSGVFYFVAEQVLSKGGIVFGCKLNKKFLAVHDSAETIDEVKKFCGSKYMQSDLKDTYIRVKENLAKSRMVLFSGTPCQVAGLKAFLGKKYSNLVTIDFICHGVPSPQVWSQYLKGIQKGKNIKEISFREKSEGWKLFSLKVMFTDGTCYKKNMSKDLYIKGFLNNLYLRPACYQCNFKGLTRNSDLTLADFWGIEQVYPDLDDNRGTSLVLCHSKMGENLLFSIKNMVLRATDPLNIIKYNKSAVESVCCPSIRDDFFLSTGSVSRRIKYLLKLDIKSKMKRKVKKCLKKTAGQS